MKIPYLGEGNSLKEAPLFFWTSVKVPLSSVLINR